ncbi:MAG TPA: hypothetical protein VGL13_10540 [Polyangiaceae bacterium]|jgi:hypothetical protein
MPLPVDAAASADVVQLDAVCKTMAGAAPDVAVGQGQIGYEPLDDLQEVQVQEGPQGGHHIWIGVRMKNLLQSGSRTTISGVSPSTGIAIAPFEVIFTFDPGEGGYCELFGLRFQLDARGVDYVPLLGKELDVTAAVTDTSGDTGQGSRRVTLSAGVL